MTNSSKRSLHDKRTLPKGEESAPFPPSELEPPLPGENEISGVRSSTKPRTATALLLLLRHVARSPKGLPGCPAQVQNEALGLAREVGLRALERSELSRADRDKIIVEALSRFCHGSPLTRGLVDLSVEPLVDSSAEPSDGEVDLEPYFRHAFRCEAIALTERRLLEPPRRPRGAGGGIEMDLATARWLDQARRRTSLLQRTERRVFVTSAALDSVAVGNESPKVSLYTAIALRLRVNSVHKHMSRARQKLFSGDGHDTVDWPDAWKYLAPPSEELAHAARAYFTACAARNTDEVVRGFADAHENHKQKNTLCKEHSNGALFAWRAFVDALDASCLKPRDVQTYLLDHCVELGIDHRVIETRIRSGQTWRAMLLSTDVKRPTAGERAAWQRLIADFSFGGQVAERWQIVEERSIKADDSKSALSEAFTQFLEAAAKSPDDLLQKRDELLRLVDAEGPTGQGDGVAS